MSASYTETLEGSRLLRTAPGPRHEAILSRLHNCVRSSVADLQSTLLLAPRAEIHIFNGTTLCPDLALVTVATGKLWLAAEVVNSEDHRPDTFIKKQVYDAIKLPRLWMIDPRYDNVEVYHGTPYGLSLKSILAGREVLTENLLPEFQISMIDLFAPPAKGS
jgi:Uma2 family endonuclease